MFSEKDLVERSIEAFEKYPKNLRESRRHFWCEKRYAYISIISYIIREVIDPRSHERYEVYIPYWDRCYCKYVCEHSKLCPIFEEQIKLSPKGLVTKPITPLIYNFGTIQIPCDEMLKKIRE